MTHDDDIELRPAVIFAFAKVLPLVLLAVSFLLLAWRLSPYFVLFGIAVTGACWYRLLYIRYTRYLITSEYIRTTRGILFKRVDQVEMFRVKDFVITQSFFLQLFKLMDLALRTTDPENPVFWLRGIPQSDLTDTIRERVLAARQHNHIYEIN